MKRAHSMPFGATVREDCVEFRLWAPAARSVALRRIRTSDDTRDLPMVSAGSGWHALATDAACAGDRYHFVIDGEMAVPDPASRFQPGDVHGPSEVIDPAGYDWHDSAWRGRAWHEAVLYEIHLGTFSPGGTYADAARRLDYLAELGVTAVELMPLSEAPGTRNWGYDGVLPFAPEHRYGRPEDLKSFVQAAHARGLMVFVDVVYNHFGPEGNYLHRYAPSFFTERHPTPWGAAIDFAGPQSRTVRDYFIHNALYWIEEFHLDGLRLDAVHAIHDESERHFLVELAEAVRRTVGSARHVHLVLENDDNDASYLDPGDRGPALYDAQWNDDLHHVLHVLATGEAEGYYADYAEQPLRRLGRGLAEGFVYQGEKSTHRDGRRRGAPSRHLPPTGFVSFIQNHDQVGNRAFGERLGRLAPAEAVRAAAAIYLLAPSPPLLFMGEEWNAPSPFPFFCDFGGVLADAVRDGRRREFARFPEFADATTRARIPDPLALSTFLAAKLDWSLLAETGHKAWLDFYRELLAVRRREIIPRLAPLHRAQAEWHLDQDEILDVRWSLAEGAILHAIIALSPDGIASAPARAQGRLIFSTAPEAARTPPQRRLPPWFVAWYIDSPGERPG